MENQSGISNMFHKIYGHSATDMKEVDDNSVDLVVTSPPYGNVVRDYTRGEWKEHKDDITISFENWYWELAIIVKECHRTLKPGGIMAINISNVLEEPKIKTNYVRHVSNIVELELDTLEQFTVSTDKPPEKFWPPKPLQRQPKS